jgi:hypothetical protein
MWTYSVERPVIKAFVAGVMYLAPSPWRNKPKELIKPIRNPLYRSWGTSLCFLFSVKPIRRIGIIEINARRDLSPTYMVESIFEIDNLMNTNEVPHNIVVITNPTKPFINDLL